MVETETPKEKPRLVLGILGAVIGGFIGMMLWFWLIKLTGYAIGYAAWGVGGLAGLGARILGREESPVIGGAAAICAAVAILGGQYMFAADFVKTKLGPLAEMIEGMQSAVQESVGEAYDEKAKYGQDAVKAQTDDEIRALYEKIYEEKPGAEELAEFKKDELPELKEIGSGKLTKEQYVKKTKAEMKKLGFTVRWELFKSTVDVVTIIFLILGIVTAFKIAAG
jgi:preprotein translocase subunit SecE